jgi:hypothetical protein
VPCGVPGIDLGRLAGSLSRVGGDAVSGVPPRLNDWVLLSPSAEEMLGTAATSAGDRSGSAILFEDSSARDGRVERLWAVDGGCTPLRCTPPTLSDVPAPITPAQ